MNKFEKWWYETGSGIRPLENEDKEEHTKRVCAQFYNDVVNEALVIAGVMPAMQHSDDMCFHECPDCNCRCNCSNQPCSCCNEV